jgi:hypothetical protein
MVKMIISGGWAGKHLEALVAYFNTLSQRLPWKTEVNMYTSVRIAGKPD